MLEIKNIMKTYKTKKGIKTVALDNVSLQLPDKGLVFILGKSGSGKSTLLNILGGLDKYDKGEIIINGKSTQHFKKNDYDAYRNTFIGFVFQEFNLLEEYTVYQNIALSLQLQKKKANKNMIDELLKKVDLEGLENRKPNELSGGQKQRVAIARALIKNPDIILADEPTGNLDTKTSEEVFKTLKELSKDKLVIVVSHDSNSADAYADRIIEFQDGIIIRDTDNIEVVYVPNKFELIKSKLPFKESFKLGVRSLNNKKIRLGFTILLTIMALVFLGTSNIIASYDKAKSHSQLLNKNNEDLFYFTHQVIDEDYITRIPFDTESINKLYNETNLNLLKSYKIGPNGNTLSLKDFKTNASSEREGVYYTMSSLSLNIIELNNKDEYIEEKIFGRMPVNNEEIVISNFLADYIIKFGVIKDDSIGKIGADAIYQPNSYASIVNDGYLFSFGEYKKVKIVGVIDYDLSSYEQLKTITSFSDHNFQEVSMGDFISKAMQKYNIIFVKEGFINDLNVPNSNIIDSRYYIESYNMGNKGMYIDQLHPLDKEVNIYNGSGFANAVYLESDEIIIPTSLLSDLVGLDYNTKLNEYVTSNEYTDEEQIKKEFLSYFLKNYNVIGEKINFIINDNTKKYDNPQRKVLEKDYKIVGIYDWEVTGQSYIYFNSDEIKPYITSSILINSLYVKNDNLNLEKLLYEYDNNEFKLNSIYSADIDQVSSTFNVFKKVFFWVSIVFFVFAIFLLSNFIIVSISYRKKEIGILRAIGAKSSDILSIFIWEGLTIAIFSFLLSNLILLLITNFFNHFINDRMLDYSIIKGFSPLIYTIKQFGLLFLAIFGIVFIASLIPTLKISKMKPIDAILNK